jgi:predicted glycoside hydrolase/deacetylase ChbG (UPF0249 family)
MNIVVNADDFGFSKEINLAIVKCFQEGLIDRTTIMVNMPFAEEAVILAQKEGFFDQVGLHLNLTDGIPLSREIAEDPMLCTNGLFNAAFHNNQRTRFFLNARTRRLIEIEAEMQMQKYISYGFPLMHLDSHHHIHTDPSVWFCIERLVKKKGFQSVRISRNIPPSRISSGYRIYKHLFNRRIKSLINDQNDKVKSTTYFGSFDDYNEFIKTAVAEGAIEIMTHPMIINGVLTDSQIPFGASYYKMRNLP